jgi:hypothetical protein
MKFHSLRSVAFVATFLGSSTAWAAPAIDKQVTLNIYAVCDDNGNNCPSNGPTIDKYFEASTNKIWAQASLKVNFSFAAQINSTSYQRIEFSGGKTFDDLMRLGSNYYSATAIDVFLVREVKDAYGVGWLNRGGIALAMDYIMGYAGGNNGLGRIDTFGHELGHNLGLVEGSGGECNGNGSGHSTNPNELMASGGIRNIPLTMAQIAPDGNNYAQINQCQIDAARSSTLLRDYSPTEVPEPSTFVLLGAGVVGLLVVHRRRTSGTSA